MQAVILAGGKGTRLASRLGGLPKPLVPVCGVALLERQLAQLAAQGVTEAVVLVNHEAAQVRSFLAGRDFGCRTVLVDDGAPRGTAGAVLACLDRLDAAFLVVYGDTLFDIDIASLVAAHRAAGAAATLLLHPNDHPADSDLVELDDNGRILAFHRYPHDPQRVLPNLVNAAFYVVERSLLEAYRSFPVPADFAGDLFPRALQNGRRLHGHRSYEYIKDLGTPSRLDKVERHLASGMVARARRSVPQRAVFLDRDGTLNVLNGYVRSTADFTLLPGVVPALHRLNEAERRVVVITNQPVLARGEATFDGMRRIHAKLDMELGREGVYVDALYLCPHHPDRGFPGEVTALKVDCDCRKPKSGLIERAIAEMNIDREQSFFVGDGARDVQAARSAGVTSIRVHTGEAVSSGDHPPDFEVQDLGEAVTLILDHYPRWLQAVEPLAAAVTAGDVILVDGLSRSGRSATASVLATSLRRRGLPTEIVWQPANDAAVVLDPKPLPANVTLVVKGETALLHVPDTDRRLHRIHIDADDAQTGALAGPAALARGGATAADVRIELDLVVGDEPRGGSPE